MKERRIYNITYIRAYNTHEGSLLYESIPEKMCAKFKIPYKYYDAHLFWFFYNPDTENEGVQTDHKTYRISPLAIVYALCLNLREILKGKLIGYHS